MRIKSFILVGCLFSSLGAAANAAVPVSVLSFKNKVGNVTCGQDWGWWRDHLGSAFQDMLLTELGKHDGIDLLERENIQDVNDLEVNLVNSEESEHKIKKGHFTKAKYTIVGSVSSYEYCANKKKIGVGVSAVAGFLGLGGAAGAVAGTIDEVGVSSANAKVVIDVRVIETQTGRIVKTISTTGEANRSNFKINSSLANYEDAQETPVGEAARAAIAKAASQVMPAFTRDVARN